MAGQTPKLASPADFKKKNKNLQELPSGLSVELKKIPMAVLLKAGILPNTFMQVAQDAISRGEVDEAKIREQATAGPDVIAEMNEMVDKVVVAAMKSPQCYEAPRNEADRDDAKLYVDEMDEIDKMYIFGWVTGGHENLEQFREGLAPSLGIVPGRETVAVPAKRASRARKATG